MPDEIIKADGFGTYTRSSYTGLDYADQRFYASTYGRFNTPDPYVASSKGANDPNSPGSWNRYDYAKCVGQPEPDPSKGASNGYAGFHYSPDARRID